MNGKIQQPNRMRKLHIQKPNLLQSLLTAVHTHIHKIYIKYIKNKIITSIWERIASRFYIFIIIFISVSSFFFYTLFCGR